MINLVLNHLLKSIVFIVLNLGWSGVVFLYGDNFSCHIDHLSKINLLLNAGAPKPEKPERSTGGEVILVSI